MDNKYLHNILINFFICCFLLTSTQCTLRKPLNGTFISKRLSSGPVYIIDSKTILVTQFTYINSMTKNILGIRNKYFKSILRSGHNKVVPLNLEFLDNKNARLDQKSYLGVNIYLKVPIQSEYDITHFKAIAIMNDKDEIKTSIPIEPEDIMDLPVSDNKDPSYKDGKFIFVYPKCCPFDHYIVNDSCVKVSVKLHTRFPIHKKIGYQYESIPMSTNDFVYEPYITSSTCIRVKFDSKDYAILLSDLELLISDEPMSKLACMDSDFDNETQVFQENVYVCLEDLVNGQMNLATLFKGDAASHQIGIYFWLICVTVFGFNKIWLYV